MKQDEKTPLRWEIGDPKLPVIQSGRMENRKQQAVTLDAEGKNAYNKKVKDS